MKEMLVNDPKGPYQPNLGVELTPEIVDIALNALERGRGE